MPDILAKAVHRLALREYFSFLCPVVPLTTTAVKGLTMMMMMRRVIMLYYIITISNLQMQHQITRHTAV